MPLKDPDARREYNRQYRQANPDKTKQWQRTDYGKNRDARLAAKREYYEQNPQAQVEKSRSYREANREQVLARQRERRRVDPEKYREMQRPWREANKGRRCQAEMIRRHGPEIVAEWPAMWQDQKGRCYLCRRELDPKATHVDHDHRCCPPKTSCTRCRRGLACNPCNILIGQASDDPALLRLIAGNLEAVLAVITERLSRPGYEQPELEAAG